MYYFLSETENGVTTIACAISNRIWTYSNNNIAQKRNVIDSALAHQDAVLLKVRHVLERHFYTLAEIVAEYERVK